MYTGLFVLEALFPARSLPRIPGATRRGFAAFLLFFTVSTYLPYTYASLLEGRVLFDLSGLGGVLGGLAGVIAYELVAYFYHRALHGVNWLFRHVHQTHHSAERLDVASAYYFHPLDMIGWTAVTSLGLVLVGLSPAATTASVLVVSFLGIFQHANLKTPRWLGYLIQRPESHTLHHGRGRHRGNYADLPVMDMLFGTFENPRGYECETGFYDGASARIGELLIGRDVSVPKEERHAWASDTMLTTKP